MEGRRRCQIFADWLIPYQLQRIVTSHEVKAHETGEILADRLRIPCQIAEGLHEHIRKPGSSFDQIAFKHSMKEFFENPERLVFGEETASQANQRFYQAVCFVMAEYSGQRIAIVSHGTVMSLFICWGNRLAAYPYWLNLGMPALAVLELPDFQLKETIGID